MMIQASKDSPWYLRLHFQIVIAMLAGILVGLAGGEAAAGWVGWMGTIFIRLLRMVIVPLIVTSIVSGVASVGSGRALGRLGLKTMTYYVATSLAAILVGLVLVNLIQPGRYADTEAAATFDLPELETPESMAEILFRLIPTNPVQAASAPRRRVF